LLVAGIYPRFINAVADVTKFRFRFQAILLLGTVVGAAGLAILLGAGTVKDLVVNHRWVMYSLFIGLTLGGVPAVWRLARPANPTLIISAISALAAMICLVALQAFGVVGSSGSSVLMSTVAGFAGASAMILPGLSGGYILLLLGQYVPILSSIEQFKDALEARDIAAAMEPALSVLLPVGIGVIVGVALVGNLVQWMLKHHRKATLGVLLGLLLGSLAALWPFQQAVPPEIGQMIKGKVVSAKNIDGFDPEDWPTELFKPQITEVAGSLCLILVGIGLTTIVSNIGGNDEGI